MSAPIEMYDFRQATPLFDLDDTHIIARKPPHHEAVFFTVSSQEQ